MRHDRVMTRERAVEILRSRRSELTADGIAQLSLFGSAARGEQRSDSDIDLLAVFDANRRISLLHVARLEVRLAAMLGCSVDLVEEGAMKQRVSESAGPDLLRVFQTPE
jgi:predicted nucleotidyltransferase